MKILVGMMVKMERVKMKRKSSILGGRSRIQMMKKGKKTQREKKVLILMN